jgi:hypothetical protein
MPAEAAIPPLAATPALGDGPVSGSPVTTRPSADSPATSADASISSTPPTVAVVAAPVALTTPVQASALARPAAAPAAAVVSQVTTHLRSVQSTPDGVHHAVLVVPSEGLGIVRVEVRLAAGTVDVSLRGTHAGAAASLRDAMPELRRSLEDSGFVVGSTDVSDSTSDLSSSSGRDRSGDAWASAASTGSGADGTRQGPDRDGPRPATGSGASQGAGPPGPAPLGALRAPQRTSASVDVLA